MPAITKEFVKTYLQLVSKIESPTTTMINNLFKKLNSDPALIMRAIDAVATAGKPKKAVPAKTATTVKPVKPVKPVKSKAVAYTGAPGQKVEPGNILPFNEPDFELSPTAQALQPSAEAEAKKKALEEKIGEYKAEIARLKNAQILAARAQEKAENAAKKLSSIDSQMLKYFSYIEHHCSKFLESVKTTKKFLYRGQHDTEKPIYVGFPRPDRKPTDSYPKAQELADKYLTIMGFKALRSNSLFTSSDMRQASHYGDIYAIFPKNGFDFTWSTRHNDLVFDDMESLTGESEGSDYYYDIESGVFDPLRYLTQDLANWYYDKFDIDEYDKDALKKAKVQVAEIKTSLEYKQVCKNVTDFYKIDEYETTDLEVFRAVVTFSELWVAFITKFPAVAKKESEINKDTKKYASQGTKYIAKHDANVTSGNKDKEQAARVIKSYGFTHENLDAAMKAEHEVCILGEYIAVNWDEYEEQLTAFFLRKEKKTVTKAKPSIKKVTK